jgi:hypothetical protein
VGVSKSLPKKARSRASRIQPAARAFVGHWRNERLPVCQNLFEIIGSTGRPTIPGRSDRVVERPTSRAIATAYPSVHRAFRRHDAQGKKLVGIVCSRSSPEKWTVSVSRPTQDHVGSCLLHEFKRLAIDQSCIHAWRCLAKARLGCAAEVALASVANRLLLRMVSGGLNMD